MIALKYAVVVEGRYDVQKLSAILSSPVLKTDGFGVFRSRETRALIRRYAALGGLYLLTDPDGAGKLIRSHIRSIVPPETEIIDLYIPRTPGTERRKKAPGKEGVLGVEGMDVTLLSELFSRYESAPTPADPVTRAELYEWGLFGRADSKICRAAVLRQMALPADLGAGRLLEAINFLYGRRAFERLFQDLKNET